jgi:hypothetical protein
VDASLFLASWTRAAGTVGTAIAALAEHIGGTWRVLPDGTVWLGTETWPASKARKPLILDEDTATGRLYMAPEPLNLLPGTTLDGRKLSSVKYVIRPDVVECIATTEREKPRADVDRTLGGVLTRLINRVMSRVDYYTLYASRVVVQHADGTIDVIPDDPRMPSKAHVPIRSLPGTKVKVVAGARVLLGFENGDPSKPIASTWEEGGLEALEIGGARPVARLGDQVIMTMPTTIPITGLVAPVPPGGTFTGTMTVTTPMTGSIITAAEKLKTG